MLVHFVKPEYSNEYDGFEYDNYTILSAKQIDNYDQFIRFIQAMIGHEVIIDKEWYVIDSYALSFPSGSDSLPCLKIFVYDAY